MIAIATQTTVSTTQALPLLLGPHLLQSLVTADMESELRLGTRYICQAGAITHKPRLTIQSPQGLVSQCCPSSTLLLKPCTHAVPIKQLVAASSSQRLTPCCAGSVLHHILDWLSEARPTGCSSSLHLLQAARAAMMVAEPGKVGPAVTCTCFVQPYHPGQQANLHTAHWQRHDAHVPTTSAMTHTCPPPLP
jgi:hypothetical protein